MIPTQHLPEKFEEEQERSQGSQRYSRISKCASPKYKSEPVQFEPHCWIISDCYVNRFKLQNNNIVNCIFYETKDFQITVYPVKNTVCLVISLHCFLHYYEIDRTFL